MQTQIQIQLHNISENSMKTEAPVCTTENVAVTDIKVITGNTLWSSF